jgi:hypothetical protein
MDRARHHGARVSTCRAGRRAVAAMHVDATNGQSGKDREAMGPRMGPVAYNPTMLTMTLCPHGAPALPRCAAPHAAAWARHARRRLTPAHS